MTSSSSSWQICPPPKPLGTSLLKAMRLTSQMVMPSLVIPIFWISNYLIRLVASSKKYCNSLASKVECFIGAKVRNLFHINAMKLYLSILSAADRFTKPSARPNVSRRTLHPRLQMFQTVWQMPEGWQTRPLLYGLRHWRVAGWWHQGRDVRQWHSLLQRPSDGTRRLINGKHFLFQLCFYILDFDTLTVK